MGISDKFSRAIRSAVKTSGNMLDITKLNMSISSNKENIKKLKIEIGEYIYSLYGDGKQIDEQLSLICDQILDKEKEINEFIRKKLEIKNVKKCYNCSGEVPIDSVYCSKCGSKIGKI